MQLARRLNCRSLQPVHSNRRCRQNGELGARCTPAIFLDSNRLRLVGLDCEYVIFRCPFRMERDADHVSCVVCNDLDDFAHYSVHELSLRVFVYDENGLHAFV